jgi:hypothetical protein
MSATERARAIRETAFKACEGKRWVECGDGLAQARDLDPEGDADARVQAAWKAMVDGCGHRRQWTRSAEAVMTKAQGARQSDCAAPASTTTP